MWRLASLKLSTSNLVSGDNKHQHLQAGPPDVYSFSHSTEGNRVVPKAPQPVGRKDRPGLHANLGLWGADSWENLQLPGDWAHPAGSTDGLSCPSVTITIVALKKKTQ